MTRPPTPPTPDDSALAPPDRRQRDALLRAVRQRVESLKLSGLLPLADMTAHAQAVLQECAAGQEFLKWTVVITSNEMRRAALAAVPFSRRLLLLPKCLHNQQSCPADIDEFGLICKGCGQCVIAGIQEKAQRLGYVVMVAEGSAVVTSLFATGKVEAVIGVSCLNMLEKVFPFLEASGVPGLAVPLLKDGCADTCLDLDWLDEILQLSTPAGSGRPDLLAMRAEVAGWFTPGSLEQLLGPSAGRTDQIAREWLLRDGKRWRPLLAACAARSLANGQPIGDEDIRRCSLAVECFHKASLIHDDIEDQDQFRYGQSTLHAQHGLAIALNVGDFLLGEGYRLIGQCAAPAGRRAAMLASAAHGHRDLCIGQGEELCWMQSPQPLSPAQVLDIFRMKTAPAFGVALRLGALLAGADEAFCRRLDEYSDALGVAYQIRDDLEDLQGPKLPQAQALKPSLLVALAMEKTRGADLEMLQALWRGQEAPPARLAAVLRQCGAVKSAVGLLEEHKQRAYRALAGLGSPALAGLLERVVALIFAGQAGWECCNEYEAPDAAIGREGAGTVA